MHVLGLRTKKSPSQDVAEHGFLQRAERSLPRPCRDAGAFAFLESTWLTALTWRWSRRKEAFETGMHGVGTVYADQSLHPKSPFLFGAATDFLSKWKLYKTVRGELHLVISPRDGAKWLVCMISHRTALFSVRAQQPRVCPFHPYASTLPVEP